MQVALEWGFFPAVVMVFLAMDYADLIEDC
jgi:hypothetical protein